MRNKGGSEIYVFCHIPSKKAMKKMRQQVKDYLAPRNKLYVDIQDLVKGLNRKIYGWKNYYSISPIGAKWLNRIDWYILERLTLFWNKKKNKRHKHARMGEVRKITKHTLAKLTT
ncbi:hypothetical protein L1765_13715 [Microaerobacter geothermalis]|uniref:group II intron maturase-specific domain-containing protein n=1 Tax=Microaerobacter geothermalis TaxID=674972 RepID=UPI001F2A0C54|nr:group II intron maturase-specific domain-containing protein [Microaerobacter geothermalis]MCF6095018.1 hypothetical protein [Microaerobacter geothermalis]